MAEATRIRLDIADLAAASGWEVRSTDVTDEFVRGSVSIQVQYSPDDEIDDLAKFGPGQEQEAVDDIDARTVVLLRHWLTGQSVTHPGSGSATRPADFARSGDGWTREGFVAAVEDARDQSSLSSKYR